MPTATIVENVLAHYGRKGMRWGIRNRSRSSGSEAVVVRDKGKRLKTSGGRGFKAHPDAVRARTLGQKGKKSGLKTLSDQELQDYSKRLNLEQNVKRLNYNDKSPPKKFILTLLGQTGKNQANEVSNQAASAAVKKVISAASR